MFGGIHTNLYGKIKDYNEIRGKKIANQCTGEQNQMFMYVLRIFNIV